jgi:hypothetical protein
VKLVVQQKEDAPFDGVRKNQVVDFRCVHLTVAVNPPNPLLDVPRVPGQVEVEQDARKLEVDPPRAAP